MVPNSVVNEVHIADLGDRYAHVAAYLRDPDPPRRRSYAPYIGSVYKLTDSKRSVTFQGECLLPKNDRGRPRILLLFSNAHLESIKNGMFHTAGGGIAALWTDLCHACLFSGDRTILGSAARLRTHCLNVTYDGPFALGFACYWLFPTFHPDHLRDLFGRGKEPPGFENTKSRLDRLLAVWQPIAIISFNGKVFEDLTGVRATGYLKRLRHGLFRAEYRTGDREYPVFQTYPTGWRFDSDVGRLRQDSLRRIADAIRGTTSVPPVKGDRIPSVEMARIISKETAQKLDGKLERLLQLADEVRSLANDIANEASRRLKAESQPLAFRDRVLIGLALKMYSSFDCLVEDARRGRSEAFHHLKTLVETFIYFHWVGQEIGETRAKLVFAKACYEKINFLKNKPDYPEQAPYFDTLRLAIRDVTRGLEDEWAVFKQRKESSLKKLARDSGLAEWYERVYRLACEPAHIGDLLEHMPLPERPISLSQTPTSLLRAHVALDYGLYIICDLLKAISDFYKFALDENIEGLKTRLTAVRGLPL